VFEPDKTSSLTTAAASPAEELRLLRAALDGTTDSVFVKDTQGRYLVINAAGAGYIGRRTAEILGQDDRALFPAETAGSIMAHDREVLRSGQPHAFEVVLPVRGEPRVFLSTKTPYRDAAGQVVGLIGISRDITVRKRAEEALRESEERLARVFESAMDAILTLDEQRTVRLFNAAAEEVFRCPAAQALGQPLSRFATPALQAAVEQCAAALAEQRVQKRYLWVPEGLSARRADGQEFPIEATISQLHQADHRWLTIFLHDVNERQRAQEELRRLQLANLYLHEESAAQRGGDEMVGESAGMAKVRQLVEQVAPTDSTVLIVGETGTGKELVARAIHSRSARRGAVLINVNCAALPAGLIESELFGHEKGAFTGALARKIGRFQMAHGGTIFLDEIGDLPLELQAKLLRVLQEGEFERVGGTETLRVSVRVIAATNRDLDDALRAQRFRADLYYRLNVFPIHVPPLRERAADIPLLVRHYALVLGRRLGKRIDAVPAPTMAALCAYSWPGNVRELQNVIERAVILSPGPTLELGEWRRANTPPLPPDSQAAPASLAELERQHILHVLETTRWRVSGPRGAAAILGLKPSTLESRLKKLGITRPT
jgi:PAS domain S-box-containing protein